MTTKPTKTPPKNFPYFQTILTENAAHHLPGLPLTALTESEHVLSR